MKIKLFSQRSGEKFDDFETRANNFMATVNVISVKVCSDTFGDRDGFESGLNIAVIYDGEKETWT
uniref:hypothetical protein n=1 Tax=Streptococcus pluranimalium TaxID=82348 RepID=UPI003F68F9CE